jgi:hypothetical protein
MAGVSSLFRPMSYCIHLFGSEAGGQESQRAPAIGIFSLPVVGSDSLLQLENLLRRSNV